MILLFQDSGILSPYVNAAITLWPVWVAIVLAAGALIKFRVWEKAGISDTNEKNIEGLKNLLETRDNELSDLERENADVTKELEKTARERDILQSEYKALAGLVISDLLHWAGRYDDHIAQLQTKDSELRILQKRIEIMEKREAENAEIHKSQ